MQYVYNSVSYFFLFYVFLSLLLSLFLSLFLFPLSISVSLSFSSLFLFPLSISVSPYLCLSLFFSVFLSGRCLCFNSPFRRLYEELKEKSCLSLYSSLSPSLSMIYFFVFSSSLCVSVITVSLSLLSIFLSGVSNGRFRPCFPSIKTSFHLYTFFSLFFSVI